MNAPAAQDTWVMACRQIEQNHLSGMYLGRHVAHDSRNLSYPWQRQAGRALTSQVWTRHGAILDQGSLGSCTGNALTGALECDPCYGALPPAHPALDENLAVAIYSSATTLDAFPGAYPPDDTGSDGPDAAKAAMKMGLISGYLHCLGLAAVLDALEDHPVCLGVNWYDSFDHPDSSGHVSLSPGASVRGGHEFLCRGKDVDSKLVICDNSWGPGWGNAGSFTFSWDDLDRLLHEQGDGTVSLPLTTTPPPPNPPPHPDDADAALFRQTQAWAGEHHAGAARAIARDLNQWYAAKGYQ